MPKAKSKASIADDDDVFICGRCKHEFRDFGTFKRHKLTCSPSQYHSNSVEASSDDVSGGFEPLLGLAEAATVHVKEHPVKKPFKKRGFKEVDAADVLANQLSGFTSQRQDVFEVTVAPSAEDTIHSEEDVCESEDLRIVEKTVKIKKQTASKTVPKKADSKSKSKRKEPAGEKVANDSEKEYVCVTCKKRFLYHKDLVRHTRVHTGEKPYVCDLCGKTFSRTDKLQMHSMRHKNIKPYACSTCDYTCINSSALKTHEMIHSDERPWRCQVCPYRSRNSSQLAVHLRRHTGDLPYTCTFPGCTSMFKTSTNLRRHQKVHNSTHTISCDSCPRIFTTKANAKAHIKAVHLPGSAKYKCKRCSVFQGIGYDDLQKHNVEVHKKSLYLCEVDKCYKLFYTKAALCAHQRTKHPEKNICCSICTVDLAKEDNAQTSSPFKGQRRETKNSVNNLDRQFHCSVCDQSFVREDSLRAHSKMHFAGGYMQSAEQFIAPAQDLVYLVPAQTEHFPMCTVISEYPAVQNYIIVPAPSTSNNF